MMSAIAGILGDQNGNWKASQAVYGGPGQAPNSLFTITRNTVPRSFAERAAASRACPYEGIRAGEVIGWRQWRVYGRTLLSVITATPWMPGGVMEGDVSLHGVHAYKSIEGLTDNFITAFSLAYGTIYMWGDIVEHEKGYRSQYASIRSLDGFSGLFKTHVDRIRELYLPNGNPE